MRMLQSFESVFGVLTASELHKSKPSVSVRINFLRQPHFLQNAVAFEKLPHIFLGGFEREVLDEQLVGLEFLPSLRERKVVVVFPFLEDLFLFLFGLFQVFAGDAELERVLFQHEVLQFFYGFFSCFFRLQLHKSVPLGQLVFSVSHYFVGKDSAYFGFLKHQF